MTGPRSGTARAVATASVLLGALVAGCTSAPSPPAAGQHDVTAELGAAGSCEELRVHRDSCHEIELEGRRFRYVLLRRKTADRTAVVDMGGPGVAVLGAGFPRQLENDVTDVNLLFVDEPWTGREKPSSCDASLTQWYRRVHDGWPAESGIPVVHAVVDSCSLFDGQGDWGFDARLYRAILKEIIKLEALDAIDFYGFSFGSVRWSYVSDQVDRAVLVSPFPLGMPAPRYVRARAAVPLPALPDSLPTGRVGGRSVDITAFDLEAARLQVQYLPPRVRTRLSDANASTVGSLSDQMLSRYAVDSISGALLAGWEEMCVQIPRWGAVDLRSYGVLGEVLGACGEAPNRASPGAPVERPACIANVAGDGVVPKGARRWLAKHHGWRTDVLLRGEPHASLLGLTRCLEELHE